MSAHRRAVSAHRRAGAVLAVLAAFVGAGGPAAADKIKNPTAVFAGLDKVTGRILRFEAAVDETVQFGALQLTPRVCYSRPPTEAPNTSAFLEVDEVTLKNEYRRIFTGWSFADSPGLNAIEHPVYDVWLTECKGGTEIIREEKEPEAVATAPGADKPERPRRDRPARPDAPRTDTARAPDPRAPVPPGEVTGRLGVEPPQGVPVQPRRPTQRFTPQEPRPIIIGRDPAGN